MHELGILRQIIKVVSRFAEQNRLCQVKHIVLEVGEISGFVPHYLTKLFPVAADGHPLLQQAALHIAIVPGKGLLIKEIGC